MVRLEEQLDKLGGGLEAIKVDMASVHTKVEALNEKKEKFASSIHESTGRRTRNLKKNSKDPQSSRHNKRNVRMITYEFTGYALVWWNQLYREINEGRRHADTWVDLKRKLRSRFVPALYARDLYNKLQCMYEGSKSVEEYHRDMEVAHTRGNVLESNKVTMTCFLHELNRDIWDIVELYHYTTLDYLVHQEIIVEAQ
ncbi:hypothetical protein CR513_14181, partial [Mucuna pruriens]